MENRIQIVDRDGAIKAEGCAAWRYRMLAPRIGKC